MNQWMIPPLIAFVVSILTGVLIFHKKPENKLNRIFLLIMGMIALWMASDIMALTTIRLGPAVAWHRVAALGWVLLGPGFLHFALTYTNKPLVLPWELKRLGNRWSYPAIYVIGIILVAIFWATGMSGGNTFIWGVKVSYTGWIAIPIGYLAMCIILGLYHLYRATSTKRWATEREQAVVVLIGALIGVCGLAVVRMVSPAVYANTPELTALPIIPSVLVVALAILKYKTTFFRRGA